MNSPTPPKGSLEDLFRFHLLESEAAAVPPRPQVWEQVDNSLLLAQNEKYRRRLAAYRWAVAASLLLASLAGGGWWHSQRQAPATGTLAQATTQPASQPGLATARRAAPAPLRSSGQTAASATLATDATRSIALSSTTRPAAIDQTATLSASTKPAFTGYSHSPRASRAHWGALAEQPVGNVVAQAHSSRAAGQNILGEEAMPTSSGQPAAPGSQPAATDLGPDVASGPPASTALAASSPATPGSASIQGTTEETLQQLATTASTIPNTSATAEATLAARLASLAQLPNGLPTSLAEVAVAPGPPLEPTRPWQYGASYSASAYNPNIEWARAPVAVANTLTAGYPASFSRSVAAEYRDNLRAGLGQRLSLWATRRLGNGRWNLRTGLELSQNTATSASSVAFVGEPVADLSYLAASSPLPLQRTSYRYRSVSVPAELRYTNPLKTGFSLYGRIGALLTALLHVRSEVEGIPEATHTYSLTSASTPYRRVSAGLRGGAGMQYRPAGHQWTLNLGPVVEMGLFSLDANPNQGFWNQQRPYSFGIEAGMEIGRGFRLQ